MTNDHLSTFGIPYDELAQQQREAEDDQAHDLIKTGDPDSFSAIEDGHGEVVLAYCRVCRKGEADLAKSCPGLPPSPEQPAMKGGDAPCAIQSTETASPAREQCPSPKIASSGAESTSDPSLSAKALQADLNHRTASAHPASAETPKERPESVKIAECVIADLTKECVLLSEALASAHAEIASLKRGEFICRECGLRKNSEHPIGHDF